MTLTRPLTLIAAFLAVQGCIIHRDTVVEHDGEELGKPRDVEHARGHLRRLAGDEHQVHTALLLVGPDGEEREAVATAPRALLRHLWRN